MAHICAHSGKAVNKLIACVCWWQTVTIGSSAPSSRKQAYCGSRYGVDTSHTIQVFLPRILIPQHDDSFWSERYIRKNLYTYEIIWVLDPLQSQPNTSLVCRLWYERKDTSEVEKPPHQKDMLTHCSSPRILCDAHSSLSTVYFQLLVESTV